jgi:hypothetical protein
MSHILSTLVALSAYVFGAILRYQFIFVDNRPTDPANIFGDIDWYVFQSVRIFDSSHESSLYDTLFPPGVSIYIAVLRWLDPSLHALVSTQWILACLVPVVLGYTTYLLFGRKNALYVFTFSSLYFPLWEYFGYFFSEGPYLFAMYLAFMLLILSLKAKAMSAACFWGILAGFALGISATFKSVALFSAALVVAALLFCRLKNTFRIWPTFVSALLGVIVILTPVSIRATRLNEGRFLLIANDASRTFLLGHQGRVGLTWWIDSQRDFRMNFINPSTVQHNYHETKTYPFGVYESGPNYAAGWSWIKQNPLEAILLSFEHVFDMFAVALPYPGYFRPYSRWVIFFNQVFIALVLLPTAVHLSRVWRRMSSGSPDYIGDIMATAAASSIFIIAFLFLGEGRYRICYDGFMIMLASRAFFPRPISA